MPDMPRMSQYPIQRQKDDRARPWRVRKVRRAGRRRRRRQAEQPPRRVQTGEPCRAIAADKEQQCGPKTGSKLRDHAGYAAVGGAVQALCRTI